MKKVTTFNIDFDLWKEFQKRLIDGVIQGTKTPKGGEVVSSLIEDFLSGKISVDLSSKEVVNKPHMAALHIDEKTWLDLDEWLVKEKKRNMGNREKQSVLSKGTIITKLIKKYVE